MTNRIAARVTSDPRIMMGKPVIKGTRIPVELIIRRLGAGDSEQQTPADYPCLAIRVLRSTYQKMVKAKSRRALVRR